MISDQNRSTRIRNSVAYDWSGALKLLHHATFSNFDVNDFAPFTHFGTRTAATERMKSEAPTSEAVNDSRLISAWLDIRNPIEISDVFDEHNALHLAELIQDRHPDIISESDIEDMLEMEAGPSEEFLQSLLDDAGIDGLYYRNDVEDVGSKSWIIIHPEQVIVQRDGPLSGSKDPWLLPEDEFIGPSFIGDIFSIDGAEEDYEHLWQDLNQERDAIPVLRRHGEWSVRWLADWDPEATLGLYNSDNTPKGFYMAGQVWIDEDARGEGLSSIMIEAAADILGGSPAQNSMGLGFSEAGYAAHSSAWRKIRTNSIELGYELPDCSPNEDFGI